MQAIISLFLEEINQQQQRISYITLQHGQMYFEMIRNMYTFFFSGAEDKHGYIWDRHYGICLNKFPHNDVVNSVAFNPSDPETLVTVSDDQSIILWRSRHRDKQIRTQELRGMNSMCANS